MLRHSMIRASVEIELARQEWAEGLRRVERASADRAAYSRLLLEIEIVTAALRRRIGQTFTLAELAEIYDGADRWALDALNDALAEDAPGETATVSDAAFALYSRRAYDYVP
jgi:hypothetical protein